MTSQPPADLLGSREACDTLHINRSTLSRWVSAGKLTPAVQLPGRRGAFLFHREDVEALRNENAA